MRPLAPLLALAFALPASAGGLVELAGKSIDDYTFSLRGRCWSSDQNSKVQDSTTAQPGSVIDLFDDTELDHRLYMPWVDAEFRFKELAIRFDYFWANDQIRGEFREGEAFDGHIFLKGDRAHTRFTAQQGSGHFEWIPFDFGSEKKIGLEIGVLIGARITRMEARFRASSTGERFHSSLVGWGPDPGVTVTLGLLNFLSVEARVSGMQFRIGTYDYRALDASVELRVFIDDHFYIGLGYKYCYTSVIKGEADERGRLLEFAYFGPFAGIGLQF
ncbi:MAG: hypothetical protein FD180_4632 [Planctomycetota bacterium]|nr:MAG: hypothetical protein FD180_4632 [Planctomycetota bacterium]